MSDKKEIRVKFSKELEDILKEMETNNSYPAFELLWMADPTSKYFNGLNISDVDVSKQVDCFKVTSDRGTNDMKILNFFRYYFKIRSRRKFSSFKRCCSSESRSFRL